MRTGHIKNVYRHTFKLKMRTRARLKMCIVHVKKKVRDFVSFMETIVSQH